jgi:hypothetical protein
MNNNIDDSTVFGVIGFFLGFIISGLLFLNISNSTWRERCIQHNVAHYNSTNGNWEWNVNTNK